MGTRSLGIPPQPTEQQLEDSHEDFAVLAFQEMKVKGCSCVVKDTQHPGRNNR
jgi:hypothetical protein